MGSECRGSGLRVYHRMLNPELRGLGCRASGLILEPWNPYIAVPPWLCHVTLSSAEGGVRDGLGANLTWSWKVSVFSKLEGALGEHEDTFRLQWEPTDACFGLKRRVLALHDSSPAPHNEPPPPHHTHQKKKKKT